ncbi:redoxin domain-containing protein [Anaerosphaera multitolerans]|uniref:Peroxiredoxin n=1 Tax=Anaerosphaera multitolerans TaxID=2487351 RepID=A0A437S9J8_9FIRM|nr:redoxin domain-containing protein [Anaerosphaera multitolerans]RVU55488.1 peroxiredoxin [Anaerosphaera multitolerans]
MENLIGKKLEEFKTPMYHQNAFGELETEDLRGKWSVFFFYPGDFTFVCPTELEDIAKIYDKFEEIDCEIYAVSTDSEFTHKEWHESSEAVGKAKYPMVADRNFYLSKFFGVLIEEEGQALRGTFIVNPELEIVAYEVHSPGIGRNAKELLRKVQAAQFVAKFGDKVCPAGWEPGDEALTPGIDLVGKI